MANPIQQHWETTKKLVKQLDADEIYHWLVRDGYFPENYVLPPCFKVVKSPTTPSAYFQIAGNKYKPKRSEFVKVHFPKTELTDRVFGIIDPEIHSDISYHISRNWPLICRALYGKKNQVESYSFPIPLDVNRPGRIGFLRSGRMIYEYLISWIVYFLVSNKLKPSKFKPNDLITKTVCNNRGYIFKNCKDFKLFVGSKTVSKKLSMLEHLAVFDPPVSIN